MSIPPRARRQPNGLANELLRGVEDNTVITTYEPPLYHEFSGCRAYNTAATISIPSNTATAVNFNAVDYDTNGLYHWDTTNPSRLYAPYDGYYLINYNVNWTATSSSFRTVWIVFVDVSAGTGLRQASSTRRSSAGNPDIAHSISTVLKMSRGDYVFLQVQSAGISSAIKRVVDCSPDAQIQLLGVDTPPEEFEI